MQERAGYSLQLLEVVLGQHHLATVQDRETTPTFVHRWRCGCSARSLSYNRDLILTSCARHGPAMWMVAKTLDHRPPARPKLDS